MRDTVTKQRRPSLAERKLRISAVSIDGQSVIITTPIIWLNNILSCGIEIMSLILVKGSVILRYQYAMYHLVICIILQQNKVMITWLIILNIRWLLLWPSDTHTIAQVPVKQPWRIWVTRSHKSSKNWLYNHKNTKHKKYVHIIWDIYFIWKLCCWIHEKGFDFTKGVWKILSDL